MSKKLLLAGEAKDNCAPDRGISLQSLKLVINMELEQHWQNDSSEVWLAE